MRLLRLLTPVLPLLLAACSIDELTGGADRYDPTDLTYRLIPSGDPETPAGILLEWTPPTSSRVASFDVLARSTPGGEWQLRATTTSPSFHDAGLPQLQYYVASMDADGNELGRSAYVEVDERNRLPAPEQLRSITLARAVQLTWAGNAYAASPTRFDYYRVYSAPYDRAVNRCVTAGWSLEGSTVSDAFLAGNLENGVARCFAVSAVSRDGHESAWSAVRVDTPRPDAKHVLLDAVEDRPASSGFVFHDVASARFGVVTDGSRTDVDFRVERRVDGSLWFRLVRPDGRVTVFGDAPIPDLTHIDRAPDVQFASGAVEAVPGFGYVFRVTQPDGVHYAAVRVGYAGRDHVVIDWAYQSAPGSIELLRAGEE